MKPAGSAIPLQPSTMPWVDVSVDFITDLPLSNGFDSILTVVDCFSKETEFIPCNKTATALDTAKLYLFHVWKDHGLPRTIISDHGLQYALQVMMDLCKQLGISPKLSTAHHLQMDSQTEVMNWGVQQYICLFCAEELDRWSDWLGLAQFGHKVLPLPTHLYLLPSYGCQTLGSESTCCQGVHRSPLSGL